MGSDFQNSKLEIANQRKLTNERGGYFCFPVLKIQPVCTGFLVSLNHENQEIHRTTNRQKYNPVRLITMLLLQQLLLLLI